MQKDQIELAVDILQPLLAQLGYTKVVRRKQGTVGGRLLSVEFRNPDPELGMLNQPTVELYVTDAYPNERGEIFLHVWNWIGMDAGGKRVAAWFEARGFRARWTSHKKSKGVRVVLPGLD